MIWIGVGSALLWQPLFSPVFYYPPRVYSLGTFLSPDGSYSKMADDMAAGLATGDTEHIQITGFPEAMVYASPKTVPADISRRIDQMLMPQLKRDRAAVEEPTRSQTIWVFFWLVVAPPVVVLLLGAALAWAIAGFRSAR